MSPQIILSRLAADLLGELTAEQRPPPSGDLAGLHAKRIRIDDRLLLFPNFRSLPVGDAEAKNVNIAKGLPGPLHLQAKT